MNHKINELESINFDLKFLNDEYITRIGELQQNLSSKSKQLLELEGVSSGNYNYIINIIWENCQHDWYYCKVIIMDRFV